MPAAPIIGLILFLQNRLSSFANRTPPTVSKMNATRPRPRIISVCQFRNASAVIFEATVMPSRSVMRFASTFCAVSDRASSTPHSRSRLPNIKKPISATARGETMPVRMVTKIGNRIFVRFETFVPV